jgi:hypothetical protein
MFERGPASLAPDEYRNDGLFAATSTATLPGVALRCADRPLLIELT